MAFIFKLEYEDGTPADPPTLKSAVPDWRVGHTIPVRPGRTLRVIERRTEEDEETVLVVEDA